MALVLLLILGTCDSACGPMDPLIYETTSAECVCRYKRVFPAYLTKTPPPPQSRHPPEAGTGRVSG